METKICICCGKEKSLDDFYIHTKMADGHLNKCKECCKEQAAKRRNEKLEYIKQYDRNRPNKEERNKRNKERLSNMKINNPDKYYAIKRKTAKNYREANRNKLRAEGKLDYAISTGKIKRPNECSVCHKKCIPHGHHYDYSKPLSVIWVCDVCHARLHAKLREDKRLNK